MERWVPTWAWPVLALFAVGTVWIRLNTVRLNYQHQVVQNETRNAQRELELAKLQATRLRSPQRLEMLARTRLKLAPPRPDQRVDMRLQGPLSRGLDAPQIHDVAARRGAKRGSSTAQKERR